MNLIFYFDQPILPHAGGTERAAYLLAQALSRHGHRISFLSLQQADVPPGGLPYFTLPRQVYPLADNTVLQDKYTILSVLNAGGFGITYLALDNPGSRYVVIKECMPDAYACRDMETGVVHPRNEQTAVNFSQSVSNSRQEASVLSQLNHPGIVQVFDMFDANGTCYYVMENIQGQTLFDLMTTMHATGQTMEPAQATDLLFRLLDILHYLHSMGVYHCDIKPSNIFIQPDGTPKLIDFGAVRTKTLQHQGLVQITPGYTPPEFYPGRRSEIGPWCDMYELGATFYELLTGQVPHPADQRSVVDRNPKVTSYAALRKTYPMNFLSGIDKALSPDERNRFHSAKAWNDYINAMAAAGTLQAGGVSRKALPQARKKSSAGTAFLIILLIATAIGWVCWKQGLLNF